MQITIQAVVDREDGRRPVAVELGTLERESDYTPSSGLGLFVRESHDILLRLQSVLLQEQTALFLSSAACCHGCGERLATKTTRSLVYRTAFGKVKLDSPQLYSRCSHCGVMACAGSTFNPLAVALPERSHPQWVWLQCRYASVMSYGLAKIFLRDAFPGGADLPASSVKVNVRAIGERLEQEVQDSIRRTAVACHQTPTAVGPSDIALQIDAGYVKSTSKVDGRRWFACIASKIVHPEVGRNLAHAYSSGYDPWAGLRQQAFLGSAGISPAQSVVVLSDGGEDVGWACKLPAAKERVLDWFHIGMRFQHLLIAVQGLRGASPQMRGSIKRRIIGAKWLLWHGQRYRCLQRLKAIGLAIGWAGANNALGRLIRYLHPCAKYLINYAQRRAQRQPFTSAGAESVVDYVIGQRMKRNGHMQWTRVGANALLQVRCAVLNGQDVRNFKRWYPPNRPTTDRRRPR